MKRTLDVALFLIVALMAMALIWSSFRMWSIRSELAAVQRQDVQAADLIAEVRYLRSLPVIVEESAIQEDRILGLVSDCLSQSGINPAVIRDVSSESQAGGTANYRRQNIRVQLDSLSVADVGRFLATWNTLHPSWIPTTVTLSPVGRTNAKTEDTSITWAAAIVFTSTYLGAPTSPSQSTESPLPPKSTGPRRGTLMPEKPSR